MLQPVAGPADVPELVDQVEEGEQGEEAEQHREDAERDLADQVAAAELAVKAWQDFGVDVSAKAATTAELEPILFGSGDWDIAWEPINVGSPDQLVPFLSGPGIADGGTNFSGIDNADYTASVEAAMAETGVEGCDDWAAAEAALFQAADIVPFANNVTQTFHKDADLVVTDVIVPTSIRMQG